MKASAIINVWNSHGQLALQLRAASDIKYPSHWDFSAAGGVDNGESSIQAAKRELKEELGIEAYLVFQEELDYKNETDVKRLSFFTASHEGPFLPNPDEVAQITFFDTNQIKTMIERGDKFHPQFLWAWEQGLLKFK